MSVANQVGLLPGFSLLVGHSFWLTLLICLALSPGGMGFVALLFEWRKPPLSPRTQFLSVIFGDPCLGIMFAILGAVMAPRLPHGNYWYNSRPFHIGVLVAMLAIGTGWVVKEGFDGDYPLLALLSPTKLYHTFILCGGYGYVLVVTFVAVVAGGAWMWAPGLVAIAVTVVWGYCMYLDNQPAAYGKIKTAHVTNWGPFKFWGPQPA